MWCFATCLGLKETVKSWRCWYACRHEDKKQYNINTYDYIRRYIYPRLQIVRNLVINVNMLQQWMIDEREESITPTFPAYMFPCRLQIGEYDQILFYDPEAFTSTAVKFHQNALIANFCQNHSVSLFMCLCLCLCVQILCPQTKLKHTLSYRFPLEQTSVSLGNVGNLRALTSPLELEKWAGPKLSAGLIHSGPVDSLSGVVDGCRCWWWRVILWSWCNGRR